MSSSRFYARALMLGASLYAYGALVPCGYAQVATQITPDGTLNTTVAQSGNLFDINGGTISGSNQFHSFGRFSVGTGDIASFNGPAGIQNILGRVTGGIGSEIDGTLRTTIAGANLFLLNPAGILFGPNASLDVQGSFHATTADYIKLGSEGIFYADPAQTTVLSVAPPSAFGFLTPTPAPIDVQTGVFDFGVGTFANVLQVPAGQTLSFVAGPVQVGGPPGAPPAGFVFAPEGRINVVSVASAGEAGFDGTNFRTDAFSQLGDVSMEGNSIIDAREVFIRGGRLTMEEATIFPGLFFLAGAPVAPPNGGEVNIEVSDSVDIIGRPPVLADTGIQTFAGTASALTPGDVPNISIKSSSVSVSGGALVQGSRLGPGNPPNLVIEADTVEVRSGSSVRLLNSFEGPGGTLTVNARNITLDSAGSGVTGLAAQANFHPAYGEPGVPFLPSFQLADSGSITVNATDQLAVREDAQISADNFSFGRSGSVTVSAGDMLLVGAGTNTAAITAQSGLAGQSEDVMINATGSINMQNGFRISANTLGSGEGGEVNVSAARSLTMTGASTFISSTTDQPLDDQLAGFARLFDPFFQFFFGVATPDYPSLRAALGVTPATGDLMQVLAALSTIPDPAGTGVPLVAVTDFTPGSGGEVSITAPVLAADADARIETSTAWDGNAGAVVANVGSLTLKDGAFMGSRSGADRLDRGPTAGSGNAGQVDVTADNSISIQGRSPGSGEGSSITTSTFGDGDGGSISLSANQVQIINGGIVSADSGGELAGQDFPGVGLTGNITISAGNEIELSDGAISTRAVTSDGGNIALTAPESAYLLNSEITTSVESGFGGGGNITIDPKFVILNESDILANAFGGPGGNIDIVARDFIISAGSRVDASSALGIDGRVNISSPDETIAAELAVLPETFLDVTGLMTERCGATAGTSSLVDAGPGGLPVDPDGYLPSFATGTDEEYEGKEGGQTRGGGGKRGWALDTRQPPLSLAQATCRR